MFQRAFFHLPLTRVAWGAKWHFYGVPIIQKHRQSAMRLGINLNLRSSVRSNPLGPNHPVNLVHMESGSYSDHRR